MGIWGGTELNWGGWRLTCPGVYEAGLTGTLSAQKGGDALIVSGELPEGAILKGATALVVFGDGSTRGYPIDRIERADGQTRVHIEGEAGFAVEGDGARHLFFPHRKMAGPVTCRIQTSAFVTFQSGAAPQLTSVGETRLTVP